MVQTHLNHKIDVVRATESIISPDIGKINRFAQQCGVVPYHFYRSSEITPNVRSHVMGLMWCTCGVNVDNMPQALLHLI